jgi:TctA family transporter
MSNILNNTFIRLSSTVYIYSSIILSILFSIFLVYISTKKITVQSSIIAIILAIIFYILLSSARGQNLEGSLPSVGYPIAPHLGLDGVSIQNLYPSKIGYNF